MKGCTVLLVLFLCTQTKYKYVVADPTYTPTHSKSEKSHSHARHSHSHSHSRSHHSHSHSRSHSYSSGSCPDTSVTSYPIDQPYDYTFTYTNATYPLWPTRVNATLSGDERGGGGEWWYNSVVVIYYNYTYFHEKNPDVVNTCMNEPDFSHVPYVRQYETWEDYYGWTIDVNVCDRACVVWFVLRLNCPLTAPSGDYYVTIPGVGKVDITLEICFNEGTDYGLNCQNVPDECRQTSAFMAPPAPPDPPSDPSGSGTSTTTKVAISFGVIGGFLLLYSIVMTILYFTKTPYVKLETQ